MAPQPRPAQTSRPLTVGFIGVHTPMKGPHILAEAARMLASRADLRFLVAGSGQGDYAASLSSAFPAGTTRFLGWTDPNDFFPEIDVLVVPSLFQEPFGRVIVEAFAHGVSVIGARSGGIAETIDDGVNGLSVPPGDAPALAAAIERLADDRDAVARFSTGALASARRYLPPVLAAAYGDLFDRLVRGRSVPTLSAREATR